MDMGVVHNKIHSFACKKCVEDKQVRRSFLTDSGTCVKKILELVYSNVCKPMIMMSIGGARYFLIFIDDFSCKIWVYVFKAKIEVLVRFQEWRTLVERQLDHIMKVPRTRNGRDYILKAFNDFLSKYGTA